MVNIIVIGLSLRGLFCGLSSRIVGMSFSIDAFVSTPMLNEIAMLKKSELVVLANHYKLEIIGTMRKGDVRKLVSNHLVDENIVLDDEETVEGVSDPVELKHLELQEKEKEREAQFRMKELEIKEREIAVQLKVK